MFLWWWLLSTCALLAFRTHVDCCRYLVGLQACVLPLHVIQFVASALR